MRQLPTCRGKRTVGPLASPGNGPQRHALASYVPCDALGSSCFCTLQREHDRPLPTSSSQHLRRMSSWAVPVSARACVHPAVGCTAPASLCAGARGTTSLRFPCGSCKGQGGCREARKRLEKLVRDQQRWPSSLEKAGAGPGEARGGSGYQGDAQCNATGRAGRG